MLIILSAVNPVGVQLKPKANTVAVHLMPAMFPPPVAMGCANQRPDQRWHQPELTGQLIQLLSSSGAPVMPKAATVAGRAPTIIGLAIAIGNL